MKTTGPELWKEAWLTVTMNLLAELNGISASFLCCARAVATDNRSLQNRISAESRAPPP